MQCPKCGATLLPKAHFCKYCGQPVTPEQPAVQHKQPVMAAQAPPSYTPQQQRTDATQPRPSVQPPQGYQPMPQSYQPTPHSYTPHSQPEPRRMGGIPRWAAVLFPVVMLAVGVLAGSLQSGGIAAGGNDIPESLEAVSLAANQMPVFSPAEDSEEWIVQSDSDDLSADGEHQTDENAAEPTRNAEGNGEAAQSGETENPGNTEDNAANPGVYDTITPAALANIWVGKMTDEYGTINLEYGFDEGMRYYRIAYVPDSGFLYYEQGYYTIDGSDVYLEGTGYDVGEGEVTETPVSVECSVTLSELLMMVMTDTETHILYPGAPSGMATFA